MAGPRSLSCGLSCSREKGCVCFGYVSTKWNLRRSGRERRTEILSVCLAFAYSCVGRPTRMEKLKPREREREKEWREKRDEKARGEDKEEVDGVEEKYRGRRRVRNRNGETWRGGNVETVIPESGIKKNLVVWRKMWGGGDRGSWTEGRYRWMVKAEEWRKEGGGCEKKCNARTCRPITCHFYRRIHSFPLLEFILRSTIAIYGACERWIIVALGTKWHFLSLRASLLTRLKKNENGRRRMVNGNLLSFFFFSSRMNQTIERMGLSRSILRFYLRVIRSWRKMFRDEIRCLRETFFLCSEYICI